MAKKRDIYAIYHNSGVLTKIYIRIKFRICPLLQTAEYFPEKGTIIDLGCGNGLFANILKLDSPERRIIGLDMDEKKIKKANESPGDISDIEFRQGNIVEAEYPPGNVFSLIDVLYLIPFAQQDIILQKCHASLPTGGKIYIKEMDTRPRWKYVWNQMQETLAVKIIGFTLGEKFYFRSREEFLTVLGRMDFNVEVIPLDRGFWYPHILYIATKK